MSRTVERTTIDRTAIERNDVERMVTAIAPGWSVERVRPSEEGSDYVFLLTVRTPDGLRKVVLKAFSDENVSPTVARSEPRLLELLRAETEIPVPRLIGFVDDHPDLQTPFFLAEHLPGENGANQFEDRSTATLERVLTEAGRHLAELHSIQPFDRFGRVGVDDGDLSVVGDSFDEGGQWTDWLLAKAEDTLDGLEGSRFDDLVPELRECVRNRVPTLDAPGTPALVHWDYRFGNLLLDSDTGETTGVLDWVGLVAGDPVYNLVTVEDHNINWQTQDIVLRRRLRKQFAAAYETNYSGDRPADFYDRKRTYHLCHRLNAMACLPDWYANASKEVTDERAAVHRAFVREYLD